MTVALAFAVLILCIATGIPIAFSLAIAGSVGLVGIIGWESTLSVLTRMPHSESASTILSTIPMFVLMGEFLSRGTLSRNLFNMAGNFLSNIRGGLGMSVVVSNGVFGAMSGSSLA